MALAVGIGPQVAQSDRMFKSGRCLLASVLLVSLAASSGCALRDEDDESFADTEDAVRAARSQRGPAGLRDLVGRWAYERVSMPGDARESFVEAYAALCASNDGIEASSLRLDYKSVTMQVTLESAFGARVSYTGAPVVRFECQGDAGRELTASLGASTGGTLRGTITRRATSTKTRPGEFEHMLLGETQHLRAEKEGANVLILTQTTAPFFRFEMRRMDRAR